MLYDYRVDDVILKILSNKVDPSYLELKRKVECCPHIDNMPIGNEPSCNDNLNGAFTPACDPLYN